MYILVYVYGILNDELVCRSIFQQGVCLSAFFRFVFPVKMIPLDNCTVIHSYCIFGSAEVSAIFISSCDNFCKFHLFISFFIPAYFCTFCQLPVALANSLTYCHVSVWNRLKIILSGNEYIYIYVLCVCIYVFKHAFRFLR